jgi:hypothetical protein
VIHHGQQHERVHNDVVKRQLLLLGDGNRSHLDAGA